MHNLRFKRRRGRGGGGATTYIHKLRFTPNMHNLRSKWRRGREVSGRAMASLLLLRENVVYIFSV